MVLCGRLTLAKLSLLARCVREGLADDDDQTDVTQNLNGMIAKGSAGVYTGGKGVLVRNPYDTYEYADMYTVVPSTFWSNDLYAPSQLFPSTSGASDAWNVFPFTGMNPDCPNDGWNGYFQTVGCIADPGNAEETGPWNYAGVGYIVGSAMESLFFDFDHIQDSDWGWGVFYPSDSNSVDWRCRWLEDYHGWDCRPDPNGDFIGTGGWIDGDSGAWQDDDTKQGTGGFPAGNPLVNDNNGGGTGCHLDKRGSFQIDQTDAFDSNGEGLTQDFHCQCNYAYNQNWKDWVNNWIANAQPKPSLPDENWLGGGDQAPSRALDMASCWVSNIRDMINIQNEIYWARDQWNNLLTPQPGWDWHHSRNYWGWNEVPINRLDIIDPANHDATFVKIPADMCGNGGGDDSLGCLSNGAQYALERDFDKWAADGYLVPGSDNIGNRPGSYMVIVREWYDDNFNWQKWFFCESWHSPNGNWQIVHLPISAGNVYGACYLDYGPSVLNTARNSTVAYV